MFKENKDIESIRKKIENVDWTKYCGPSYYDAESVAPALLSLLNLTNPSEANEVGDRVLSAIGNNHAGTYYPAILSALDILIEIEKESKDSVRKNCAHAILIDLSCFKPDPDLGGFASSSLEDILNFSNERLTPNSN